MNKDWYNLRNKRTDGIVDVNNCYKDIKIAVVVQRCVEDIDTQLMLVSSINILSRWCSNFTVFSGDTECKIPAYQQSANRSLLKIVEKIIFSNDPNAEVIINKEGPQIDLWLYIGTSPSDVVSPYINIDCNGWVASCSYNRPAPCKDGLRDGLNPLSPCFAACLANAEAFRWAVGKTNEPYAKWYSIMTYETSEIPIANDSLFNNNLSLGRVHLVGCGAIGSSCVFLLSLTQWTGILLLADMDRVVELHNTSSSLLFTDEDVEKKRSKVDICQGHLANSRFKVSVYPDEYGTFVYDHRLQEYSADLILCFANDRNIWSTLQHLYPPVTFHATTSSSWGVNIGRHIPFKDECIYCTFKELMKTTFIPKCAEGEFPDANHQPESSVEKPSAILPFLSPTAAILTLTEVYKLYSMQDKKENSLQLNMNVATGDFVFDHFKPFSCPVCRDQQSSVYSILNQNTLLWHLSQ